MKRALLSAVVCLLTIFTPTPAATAAEAGFPQRWNYGGGDCATAESTDKAIEFLKQSKAVGCTHVLFNEARIHRLGMQKPEYFENAKRLQAAAKEMGITLCIGMVSMGYSGTYFHYDSNLAAGIPVKDMPYVVKGQSAAPDAALALDVSKLQAGADGTLSGAFDVKPFQLYRVTFFTTGKTGDPEEYVRVNNDKGRWVSRMNPQTKKDGERTRVETIFNTLEGTRINVRIGGQGGTGKIEELKIEPAGMLLILRRPLIPLVVTNEDKSVTYKEGEDFKPVSDPIVTVQPFPGEFPLDHPAPVIELTPNSKIKDGQKLSVSFFHHMRIYSDEDTMSLEDPKTWPILEAEIRDTIKAWPTGHYFLNYDEIRAGGWEPMPEPSIKTPGQLLAWHFKKSYDLVKKNAPGATVYTWSDMFTPHHNARGGSFYYLVNGNWDGSWEGLPKDVVIMNWYAPKPEGMKFFADRGHKQVLCGYYDGRSTAAMKKNIKHWMDVSQGVPGVNGFMYTTWQKNYANLKEYFNLVDTYATWSKDQPGDAGNER